MSAAAAFAAWLTAPAVAQEGLEDRIIVTASGRATNLDDAPVSIAIIDGDTIESRSAIRIGDVLADAPGVFLSGLNGPREIAQIRQPLAFDNRTLFLEDGVPLQSSIFFDQSALGYSIALASPGGIEVLRGPGTALYGSDALSGVVHVKSKSAPDAFEGGLRVRGGEFGLYDLQGEVGGPIGGGHKVRLTAALSGEEGFRDETSFYRAQGIVRHAFDGEDWSIDSLVTVTDYETESATAIPYSDFLMGSRASGLSPLVDVDDAVEEGFYLRAQTTATFDLSETVSTQVTPYYRRQDIAATATFRPATVPRTEALVETVGVLARTYWDHGANASTVFGVDMEFTWFDRLTVQDAPDTIVFGDLFRQGVQYDYAVNYRGLSPYVQHERRFGDVTLTLGLRYDSLRYDLDNALVEEPGDAVFQVSDRVDNFDALSPKAGLVWRLSDEHSVFARYARGFRIPRESDLYELNGDQSAFTLEPERLDSGEIGWRGDFGAAQAELVGYWGVSTDGVITDVQTEAGNISVNAGSSRYAGVEASLAAELGAGVSLRGAFAFQDFRFRKRSAGGLDPFDGNLISEAPRTLGTLDLAWTPPAFDALTLVGRLRHIGSWALDDGNTAFTDDEFIMSLFGRWRVTDRLELDLTVENVTDEIYAVFADAPSFRPAGRARPGQVRRVSGGVRLAF